MPHPTQIQSPNRRRVRAGFRPDTTPDTGLPAETVSPLSISIPTVISPMKANSVVSIINYKEGIILSIERFVEVLTLEMNKNGGTILLGCSTSRK